MSTPLPFDRIPRSALPALLRRMIRNLIENAERHGAPPVDIEVRPEGGTRAAILTVSDHGPGIAAADRDRVFQPFYRLPGRDRGSGAGLGLTLVRQIARQHGGEACWTGTSERPSTLRIVLPLSNLPV